MTELENIWNEKEQSHTDVCGNAVGGGIGCIDLKCDSDSNHVGDDD